MGNREVAYVPLLSANKLKPVLFQNSNAYRLYKTHQSDSVFSEVKSCGSSSTASKLVNKTIHKGHHGNYKGQNHQGTTSDKNLNLVHHGTTRAKSSTWAIMAMTMAKSSTWAIMALHGAIQQSQQC